MPMTNRQRILALLRGQQPDRVPWFGDLSYWIQPWRERGEVSEVFESSQAYVDMHRELGVGFYLQGYFPYRMAHGPGVEEVRYSDGNRRIHELRTPKGTLREVSTHIPEAYTDAPTEHLIKGMEDLAVLRYVYEQATFEPDYAFAEMRRPWVEEAGIILCYGPKTPLMQLVALDAGIETVVGCFAEDATGFQDTLELMEARLDEALDLVLRCPADCLMIPENLSSEVVGRMFYDGFAAPCHERWTERIRHAGKPSFIHMDGTLRGLIRQVAASGFDVLEALTPEPVGDMGMSAMREMTGPGPVLWGGLPGVYFTPLVDDEAFERHVITILEYMRRDRRCVLGVADQVPPDGLRDRVARVAELADQYGVY